MLGWKIFFTTDHALISIRGECGEISAISRASYTVSARHAAHSGFRCSECDDARAGGAACTTHALRTLVRQTTAPCCSGPAPGTQTLQNMSSQQYAKPACPYHPSDPPRVRLVGHRRRCLSRTRRFIHGRSHMARPMRAASTARAHLSSPRPLSQPPRATFLIDLLLVCCRAECARRLVPIWIRRDLGGRLPPPPRLLGSSRCAPSTEPQCVPFAPCRRNGVPRPSPPAQDVSKRRALRTPAWRMPY